MRDYNYRGFVILNTTEWADCDGTNKWRVFEAGSQYSSFRARTLQEMKRQIDRAIVA